MAVQKIPCLDKNEEEVVLPGFRFHPTDEELVGFYLRRKVEKKPISIELIRQVDIYKYDPWDLPKVSTVGEKEWYFFCIRGRKYRNSIRPNRVTGSGFWKATGIDKPIYSVADAQECIGLKKSLVYYRGSAGKGTKTDWMMHEFRLPVVNSGSKNTNTLNPKNTQEAEILTLCRIFKRNVTSRKYPQDWRDSSSIIKQNPTDSSSKTSSFECDSNDTYKCFGATSSTLHQIDKKHAINQIDERNQLFSGSQLSSMVQTPFTAFYSDFPNSNSGEFCKDGNWDELGSVVEFAMDPTHAHGCR